MKRIILCLAILFLISISMAEIPRIMNYSARLTDDDGLALDDAGQTIAFLIYDTSTGGTPLWAETLSVAVVNGFMDIALGEIHEMNIAFAGPYWIELQVDSDDDDVITASDEIMTPREKLAPVAFAHRAVYADTADNCVEDQNLSEVLTEGNDAEGSIITGLPSPSASSDAVNKAYVDALESGDAATRPYCVYIHYGNSCPAGWAELGSSIGPYYGSSSYRTKVCCQSESSDVDGYLVLSGAEHNGNFSGYGGSSTGLEGANLWCLDQVKAYNWNGKGDIDSLTATNVRAFLCDDTECNNLAPNSSYQFSSCTSTTYGGAAFISDDYGRGPRDANNWATSSYFGGGYNYWMNRGLADGFSNSRWGTLSYSATSSCSNWSSSSSALASTVGYSSNTSSGRWYYTYSACDNVQRLICIVNK